MFEGRDGHVIEAAHVDAEHLVPLIVGDLENRLAHIDTGHVAERVDTPEGLHGLIERLVAVGADAQVDRDTDGFAALGLEPRDGLVDGGLLDVHDRDLGAALDEKLGDRIADALRTAGNDNRLAFHCTPPCSGIFHDAGRRLRVRAYPSPQRRASGAPPRYYDARQRWAMMTPVRITSPPATWIRVG